MVLGDAVSKLETFVWILNHISRSITWSMLNLKSSNLVKWPISTWSLMWWCQIIDWLKFETRPRSLMNFGTAYCFCPLWLARVMNLVKLKTRRSIHKQCSLDLPCLNGEKWTKNAQASSLPKFFSRGVSCMQPAPRTRRMMFSVIALS